MHVENYTGSQERLEDDGLTPHSNEQICQTPPLPLRSFPTNFTSVNFALNTGKLGVT